MGSSGGNSSKKTMGRRKIEIKKIEKKTSLQVTFSKRRTGLFRKASELSVLCGAEIAILIQSPAGKIFSFGNPSVESVLGRFQTGGSLAPPRRNGGIGENRIGECAEEVRRLEGEKEMEKSVKEKEKERELWWDEPFESMELDELEEYAKALEGLRDNVLHRVEEMEKQKQKLIIDDNNEDDNGFGSLDWSELMNYDDDTVEYSSNCGFPAVEFDEQEFDGCWEGVRMEGYADDDHQYLPQMDATDHHEAEGLSFLDVYPTLFDT
ncbi:UNVERIFIED_CONTAM: Agamous-like MADS-box protein [Sesamum radiatum]|uniref:Agamous-like MADS-box protein n=1 Tax=Sesamum radiatum TaxID=300843 RepID=A0AAW2K1U5_SESRA